MRHIESRGANEDDSSMACDNGSGSYLTCADHEGRPCAPIQLGWQPDATAIASSSAEEGQVPEELCGQEACGPGQGT